MKRKLMTLFLAGAMVWGSVTGAQAVDFKASGEWFMGFGASDGGFAKQERGGSGRDVFKAQQRLRLQLEAIVSESLSGTLQVQIGDTKWGNGESGGALGADGKIITMRSAYIDWFVPNTELQFRMGMQGLALPNVAGGAAILDDQVAAIVASYQINDNAAVTALWARPFNDNWVNNDTTSGYSSNYLDNVDIFALTVPLSFDGFDITPWASVAMVGKNALSDGEGGYADPMDIAPAGFGVNSIKSNPAYGTVFFVGLPIAITAADPFNFELDINYGSATGLGDSTAGDGNVSSNRSGFVIKALAEYSMDWGRPGLFAWYASGDDGNMENGSERMPTLSPSSNFTTFMQDGVNGWSTEDSFDLQLSYSGSWGIGAQIADMSFIEDLSHTLRIAYWGGTNSTGMIRHLGSAGWVDSNAGGIYLTTDDHLIEVNLDTTWQIYENLQAVMELGYIYNGVNHGRWEDKAGVGSSIEKQDAWKANLLFLYSF